MLGAKHQVLNRSAVGSRGPAVVPLVVPTPQALQGVCTSQAAAPVARCRINDIRRRRELKMEATATAEKPQGQQELTAVRWVPGAAHRTGGTCQM